MTHRDVSRFVTHALDDYRLREKLGSDPDAAFDGYDLTGEERDAVSSADEHALLRLGLDPMTARSWKAFHDAEEFAPDRPDAPGDVG